MIPTRRLERAVLALVAASVAAIWLSGARVGVALADALLLALAAVDFLATPSPRRLDVRRSLPERAGLSCDFVRVARVHAGRAAGLELELHEEFSPALEVRARSVLTERARAERFGRDAGLLAGLARPVPGDPSGGPDLARLPAEGPLDLRRVYRASRRGVEGVGELRLRLTGRLGLIQRQARLVGERTVAIEPPLAGLRHTLQLAASERWRDLGVRRVRRRGGLTEFESLRDYVHGDDVRLVDWKAFARRGRPTVREFQEERGQELVLLVDCGRRMGAVTEEGAERGWTKLDHALDTALQLAAVALGRGDRVGICAFDAAVRAFVPPARGARQLARLSRAVFDLAASDRESDLEWTLRELAVRQRRRALLLILSDVADPLSVEHQRRALAVGARHHRILFAGLDDPSLRRAARGEGAERPAVRAAALGLAAEREAGLRELAGAGVRVLDSLPAESAGPLLAAWLDARRR